MLSTTDFFLVDVDIIGGDSPVVCVSVDGEDRGVNMEECARISNELGFLMDAHELFSGQYRINVSSPGLDRPLIDRRQYPKNEGRKVEVKYEQDGEDLKVEGILQEVTKKGIAVEINEQITVNLPFEDLVETKIIPSFK